MQKCIENLTKNGFEVVVVESSKEALEYAKKVIFKDAVVGLGGSITVKQIGLLDYLVDLKDIKLLNQYEKGISSEENSKRRREGLLADIYITSTNAITKNGELLNADGSGNRVAAQIFGPKKVLLFAGVNKIVDNFEDAIKRINEVAIPKNIERINKAAKEHGKEGKYNAQNIANKFSYINGDDKGRTTIVLIKEELGF
ncbi:DUF162 domain-containing protein [Campylobacter blaseri]|uniref:LUD domain-containing protein n=1 Tax=Campylobacter blaseri TaxID=2042961 RepID=A0A2P8R147_9BACT|nr:lactate utilization protein [Campylobacter blaseri]PSM52220.1 hypothetical protein CQ405_03970 [Campylobacter blaseri]PSM53986.1 hypothetical protein CRN67_03970 [Campylobacter blaseri]QKF85423.1 DUF162 domain-containing protein [Campylobacter blaseri]